MAQVKIENVTKNNREAWLRAIWDALDEWSDYVEDDLESDEDQMSSNHDEVCTAMAWVREALGLPDLT